MKRIFTGKQLGIVVLALGVAVGCATTPQEPAAPGASAEATQAIDGAKAAIAQAKSVDWLWRDTETFLSEAEAAAAKVTMTPPSNWRTKRAAKPSWRSTSTTWKRPRFCMPKRAQLRV